MRKRFTVCLVLPVMVEVEAERKHGEVNVISVYQVIPPSVSDIRDASLEENLDAIDEAFEDAKELKE